MIDKFKTFADAVRARFNDMATEPLFIVNSDREVIWGMYLDSFPAESNPMFRERTEHDCSCCRAFIRDIGAVVAIQNGALVSVWDLNGLPYPYQDVADAMAEYVHGLAVDNIYLTPFAKHGTAISHEQRDSGVWTWNHFAVNVPKKFVTADYIEKRGDARTTFDVLYRGLTELTPEALSTVADLIRENALYRGMEHEGAVLGFQQLQGRFMALVSDTERDLLVWQSVNKPVARFRNTVIGTLVQDLSSGVDLDVAVKAFETKVAPQNYKRPTSLITKAMVQSAMETINELGLEPALERRHARLEDVSVNSVLFVDGAVRGRMKGGLEEALLEEVKPAKFDPKTATEIGIDDFVTGVLPKVKGLNLYLENGHMGNFVSMTAPVHADSGSLFRWGNDFAWSYDGNVTDTIKERVKRAGGRVEGVTMRVSLAWSNTDDLDLHVMEPSGNHIYFGNKSQKLDVDMNVGHVMSPLVRDPVENIRWVQRLVDGRYEVAVHSFTKREAVDVGFTVEVEMDSGLETLWHEKALRARLMQPVVVIMVQGGRVVRMEASSVVVRGSAVQEKWGLKTQDFIRVNSLVLSPNYWSDPGVGNKHWFFILDGCKNPLPTRGIYNEFLHPRLEKHRKVFEVLGEKTKCPVADEQLSGVGFSSTRRDKVTVMAMGPKLNKPYTIVF